MKPTSCVPIDCADDSTAIRRRRRADGRPAIVTVALAQRRGRRQHRPRGTGCGVARAIDCCVARDAVCRAIDCVCCGAHENATTRVVDRCAPWSCGGRVVQHRRRRRHAPLSDGVRCALRRDCAIHCRRRRRHLCLCCRGDRDCALCPCSFVPIVLVAARARRPRHRLRLADDGPADRTGIVDRSHRPALQTCFFAFANRKLSSDFYDEHAHCRVHCMQFPPGSSARIFTAAAAIVLAALAAAAAVTSGATTTIARWRSACALLLIVDWLVWISVMQQRARHKTRCPRRETTKMHNGTTRTENARDSFCGRVGILSRRRVGSQKRPHCTHHTHHTVETLRDSRFELLRMFVFFGWWFFFLRERMRGQCTRLLVAVAMRRC